MVGSLGGMKIVVVPSTQSGIVRLVTAEFAAAGAEVDTVGLAQWLSRSYPGVIRGTVSATPSSSVAGPPPVDFRDKDLAVVVADEIGFLDSGGPVVRQVASWAQHWAVPVIVVASRCEISTRELRTVGVEAAYAVGSAEDVRKVVRTWIRTVV